MTKRQVEQLLWSVTALSSLGALTAGFGLWLWPAGVGIPPDPTGAIVVKSDRLPDVPALSAWEPIWNLDLRRSIGSAAAQAAVSKLGVKLFGTIVEPGFSQAIFLWSDGRTEMKGVSDIIANAQILEIKEDSVRVLFNGDETVLRPPPSPGSPP